VRSLVISKLSASLVITNFSVHRSLIVPIFNAYPLRSASPEILSGCNKVAYHFRFGKYFDFKDWEKAINIKSQSTVLKKEVRPILV